MDEKTAKQLLKQLKLINFWISVYGVVMIAILGFLLYMIFQLVTFVQDTNRRIDEFRNATSGSINIQKQSCDGGGVLSEWLKANTESCR